MNLSEEGALERFRSARVGETELRGRTSTDGGAEEGAAPNARRRTEPRDVERSVFAGLERCCSVDTSGLIIRQVVGSSPTRPTVLPGR